MQAVFSFYEKAFENMASFSGSGLVLELFFLCLLFLFFKMDEDYKKHMLLYFPLAVLVIYFMPIWAVYTSLRDDSEILYRIFWLIPVGVVVCFSCVTAISMLPKNGFRHFAFLGAVLLLIFSGEYTYGSPFYSPAENIYHVPDSVVKICEEIEVPGREIRACFPEELVSNVRQYSSVVFLTYGRASLITNYREVSPIQELLREDIIDTKSLIKELRRTDTPYLVISEDKLFTDSLWDYDFAYVTTVEGYDIYLDNTAYIGLWDDQEDLWTE